MKVPTSQEMYHDNPALGQYRLCKHHQKYQQELRVKQQSKQIGKKYSGEAQYPGGQIVNAAGESRQ
jgi:hypothetical protein